MPLSEQPPRFSACFGPRSRPTALPPPGRGSGGLGAGSGAAGRKEGVRGKRRRSFCSWARADHVTTSGGRGGPWGLLATCHLTLSPGKEEQGARK